MPSGRTVFADIESIGLDPHGPIRQIAAIAVDGALREVEAFEVKIQVDWKQTRSWRKDRRRSAPRPRVSAELDPAQRFGEFLRCHATVSVPTIGGASLRVAQLAAHNAGHDGPFLQAFFDRNRQFYPASFRMLCTVQRALWFFQENRKLVPPPDFKLATLCGYFNISFHPNEAHDALADVRATVALYRELSRLDTVRAKWSRRTSWRYSSKAGPASLLVRR